MPTTRGQKRRPLRLVHMILDSYGITPGILSNPVRLIRELRRAAMGAHLRVVGSGSKRFRGGGVTAFLILSESHISVHTWPEHSYAGFDIFSCDSRYIEGAEDALRGGFPGARWEIVRIQRGRLLHHRIRAAEKNKRGSELEVRKGAARSTSMRRRPSVQL